MWHVKPMRPFFSKMFRHKTLDVVTCFYKNNVAASNRVLTILKQANAHAQETATEDQATDHTPQNESVKREPFELDLTESIPTEDQLRSIAEYMGDNKIGDVVTGATSITDAVKKLAADEGAFKRPLVVDWNQGRVVIGDDELAIRKLLRDVPSPQQ